LKKRTRYFLFFAPNETKGGNFGYCPSSYLKSYKQFPAGKRRLPAFIRFYELYLQICKPMDVINQDKRPVCLFKIIYSSARRLEHLHSKSNLDLPNNPN